MGGGAPTEDILDRALGVHEGHPGSGHLQQVDGDLHSSMLPVSFGGADLPVDAVVCGVLVEDLRPVGACWVGPDLQGSPEVTGP
eukprot:8371470-Pyramimonas_sp.AAC.1